MYDNIRIIPLTLEEFIEQKVPAEHKDKIEQNQRPLHNIHCNKQKQTSL